MTVAVDTVTLNIGYEGLKLTVLLTKLKKLVILRNVPNSRLVCSNHTLNHHQNG